jgi:hypothetical protein
MGAAAPTTTNVAPPLIPKCTTSAHDVIRCMPLITWIYSPWVPLSSNHRLLTRVKGSPTHRVKPAVATSPANHPSPPYLPTEVTSPISIKPTPDASSSYTVVTSSTTLERSPLSGVAAPPPLYRMVARLSYSDAVARHPPST